MNKQLFSINVGEFSRLQPVRSTILRGLLRGGAQLGTPERSGESLAGYQGMAAEKVLRTEAFPAFTLEHDNAEGLLSTGNDDAAPARFQDLARRTGTLIGNFCLPDLQQGRLWFGGQIRVGAGPWNQGANAVPQAARRLGPVQAPVFLGNLASVARPGLRLFAGNDFPSDIFRNGFHQQPGAELGKPAGQRLRVVGWREGSCIGS